MRSYVTSIALAIVFGLTVVLTCPSVQAQSFKVIHTFTGGQDGGLPYAGVTMDRGGNLYGTAGFGGKGFGTVFKLALKGSNWVFTPLYSFQGGSDGAYPSARVIFGPDGTLYGTTYAGGSGYGTVFNLRPQPRACTTALCPWTETVLYRFTGGTDGAYPGGDLLLDLSGTIYGTTSSGGAYGQGTIFSLKLAQGSWAESVLYSFTGGTDGGHPGGGVIFDQAGNLYGVASSGGASSCGFLGEDSDCGTVFQLTPSGSGWMENTILDFSTCCVTSPVGGLVFDTFGNLYGVSFSSPNPLGDKFVPGSVYEIQNSNGNWIQVFDGDVGGVNLPAGVTMDAAGNLYGVGDDDGYGFTDGLVYELSPSNGWTGSTLYIFSGGSDGGSPGGTVLLDANGKLYGTASAGGVGYGVVWEITQ